MNALYVIEIQDATGAWVAVKLLRFYSLEAAQMKLAALRRNYPQYNFDLAFRRKVAA
jgi:hypothetical protein